MINTIPPADLNVLFLPPRSEEINLPTLLQTLYSREYTGTITLHFQHGKPRIVQFEAPQLRVSS